MVLCQLIILQQNLILAVAYHQKLMPKIKKYLSLDKKDQKQGYEPNAKYKPRPFQGEELSEGDVKKILGELKNQEQRISANFEKKERKEKKNDKDW